MHGNINFVWNKIKDKEKFPHVFHKQLYLHGIYGNIMNTSLKEKRTKELVVQIPLAAPFISMHPDNIRGRWRRLQRGRLVYGGSDSSIESDSRLQRSGGLVYRGQDSSTDREACLWDLSKEG
jgi:hypothetical protein